MWPIDSAKKGFFREISEPIHSLAFHRARKLIGCGTNAGKILLLDAETKRLKGQCGAPMQGCVKQLAFSPWIRPLVAGAWHDAKAGQSRSSQIGLIDTSNNKEWFRIAAFSEKSSEIAGVYSVAFSPDGQILAAAGFGGPIRLLESGTGKEICQLGFPHRKDWQWGKCIAFSPDGKKVAAATLSGLFQWDVTASILRENQVPKRPLAPHELDTLWDNLQISDSRVAFRSMLILEKFPTETLSHLTKAFVHLPVTEWMDIKAWIGDLDSTQFAVREAATQNLAKEGARIANALRDRLMQKTSLETRMRIEGILRLLPTGLPDRSSLRLLRTIGLLERIKTREAIQLLERFGQSHPDNWLAQEALEAARRVSR